MKRLLAGLVLTAATAAGVVVLAGTGSAEEIYCVHIMPSDPDSEMPPLGICVYRRD